MLHYQLTSSDPVRRAEKDSDSTEKTQMTRTASYGIKRNEAPPVKIALRKYLIDALERILVQALRIALHF